MMNGHMHTMCSYRLTNVTHSEIAQCLPLPGLPSEFGAASACLHLYDEGDSDERSHVTKESALLSQKIANLLTLADISYLSVREKGEPVGSRIAAEKGSLLEAVLRCEPEAFSYKLPSPVERRTTRQLSARTRSRQTAPIDGFAGSSSHVPQQSPQHSEDGVAAEAPISTRRTRRDSEDAVAAEAPSTRRTRMASDAAVATGSPTSTRRTRMSSEDVVTAETPASTRRTRMTSEDAVAAETPSTRRTRMSLDQAVAAETPASTRRTRMTSEEAVAAETPASTRRTRMTSEEAVPAETPPSTRRTRMRRKEAAASSLPAADRGALVSSFCEMLDELLERTDMAVDEDGEESGSFLSLAEIKMVGEEINTLRVKNALNLTPTEHLIKLLSLLYHHVKRANGKDAEDDDDEDSESYSILFSAFEAVQGCLWIIVAPDMPKQVYKEEIIDGLIEFTRYHIVHTVFAAYDPVYRHLQKWSPDEVDEEDWDDDEDRGEGSAKKRRNKGKAGKARKPVLNRVSGSVSNVLHKLCSILGLMKDLLAVERLLDSTVLQLTKTILSTFGVDNIQLLQLKAIGVACMVFDLYPQHRTVILDEIIAIFWKLPTSRKSLRTFHLQDDDQSKQIQMLTAILLQIVQCSVTLPNVIRPEPSTTEEPLPTLKCFEPAMESSTYFWKIVLQRWATPKAQEGADSRALVENLVTDLLTTLHVPEFPASSLLLQALCFLLFGQIGMKAKDAIVRGTAIDLLGAIAARLKQDAVACSNEELWILQDMHAEGNSVDNENAKKKCVVCGKGKSVQALVPCEGCLRWFHADCISSTGHDQLGRGWLCHYCMCKKQITSLRSDVKLQVTGSRNKKPETLDNSKERAVVIQQILLNYLGQSATSDGLVAYAHRFYLCQWYRDEAQGIDNLPFYHSRLISKAPLQDFGSLPAPLSRKAIVRISGYLGQQRPLARGFDRILERLLASLRENSSTPRAKALRAVSAMVEVYPDVLGDDRVQRAVEGRFLDSSISVREAAMELVGRHIVSRPDFAVKYFEKISERIMDTGVSVRKRVIKIIRDVCLSNAGFAKAIDGCVKIISRINDEESSIQDLVGKTFHELWFEDQPGQSTQYVTDGSVVPLEIAQKTQQLVDVLRTLPNNQAIVVIIKRSLALNFCPQAAKNSATSAVTQAAVRRRCELMCKCLLESILKAEETAAEDEEIRALPHIMALHAFCTVDPTLCAPASDPSRYAVTLQPYLKTQIDNRDAAQLLQSIVFVIDTVLPLIRRPPQSLVVELERDLRQLILRYSFLTVVYACIKCLCSLSKVATKGVNSFEFLVRQFFKLLDTWRKDHYGPADKSNVQRYLFCLGVLVRYGSDLIESMDNNDVRLQQILDLYKHYMVSEDYDIKEKALQAVGYVSIAKPDFFMEKEMGALLEASLNTNAQARIKMQMLRNFSDYLLDVEEKMGISEAVTENGGKPDQGKAVPVAAGAGDSNICGGIIQLHWDKILARCLDHNCAVRHASLKLVEIVLRQGLVHPMTCVPQLIAMEVDHYEANSKLAHRLLMQLNEKYPSFFESRLGDGLQLSFSFIQSGAASSVSPSKIPDPKLSSEQSTVKIARSGISRIYKLIRGSRVSRNKFLSSVIRKFDSAASGAALSVPFLIYCAEVLSSLPFGLPDEPLYVVFSINRVVQVRGGVLEANMKASISEGALGEVAKQQLGLMAAEKEQEGAEAYDINASEEKKPSNGSVERVDDTQGIPEEALQKLRVDCNSAMALALLLRLKRHMKIVYSLNDARCQAFSPSEPIKAGDVISKRESVKDYSTEELPTGYPTTVRQMLEQYQAFKRLLKEDAMDYSAYSAIIPARKRGRVAAITIETTAEAAQPPVPTPKRTLRRKSQTQPIVDGAGSDSGDDDSDSEWVDKGPKRGRPVGSGVRSRSSSKRAVTVQ